LLLALTIFCGIHGVKAGNVEILGIQGIRQRSEELDEKIQEAGKLAEKDYEQAVSTVKTNAKELENQKQEYEEMISISSSDDVEAAKKLLPYEIEKLWVKLGNHATSEGVVMKMDVVKGTNTTENTYNLKFTATGSYISITDFISDIENDSDLGFKIEEFTMLPGTGSDLQATFVCKGISINDIQATTSTTTTSEDTESTVNTTNTTNTNSTNTTNTNSANTTNTTNTNSTNTKNTNTSSNNTTNVLDSY
jgi:hypothetical protein